VHEEEETERDQKHRRANRGGLRVAELFEPDDYEERGDLGIEGHVAGDEDHRSVFAHSAGKREGKAGKDGRHQAWKHHAEYGLPAIGA